MVSITSTFTALVYRRYTHCLSPTVLKEACSAAGFKKNSSFLGHERDWENVSYRCHNLKYDLTNWMKKRHLDTFPTEKEIARVTRPDTVIL